LRVSVTIGNDEIILDASLSVEERIQFVDDLIQKYEPWLTYRMPINYKDKMCSGYKVESILEHLASYILNAVKVDEEYPWQTFYKKRQSMINECNLTDFEQKMNKF